MSFEGRFCLNLRRFGLTGIIPLVRSVGYEYASLLWLLDKIFWRVSEMSRPSAVTDEGMAAALTCSANGNARARIEEIISKSKHKMNDRKATRV
jgi:hypothetical protein